MEKATFGAGCFWGVEAAYRNVPGVTATAVGYLGGTLDNPDYKQVCSGRTGHAEVVEVEFDPSEASYEDMLAVFWREHDPTQMNRQGWDVGTQYRSAIFTHSPEQTEIARTSLAAEQGRYRKTISTEITPASTFFPA
ncbi:MAG: peptide-methionine (S)-S-oxide reductase MsrA, partial [Gaiellaceae bacterium]